MHSGEGLPTTCFHACLRPRGLVQPNSLSTPLGLPRALCSRPFFSRGPCPVLGQPRAHGAPSCGAALCRPVGACSRGPKLCAGQPHASTWNRAQEPEAPLSHGFQYLAPWPAGPRLCQARESFGGPASAAHAAFGQGRSVGALCSCPVGGMGCSRAAGGNKGEFAPFQMTPRTLALLPKARLLQAKHSITFAFI